MKNYILASIAIAMGLTLSAQTFEEGCGGYTSISTYDSWVESPFRTGKLAPNALVVDNPFVDDNNPTAKCVGYQHSRMASNIYGVRIDLAEPFELGKETQYVHALIHRPKSGQVLCIGLGHKRGVAHQQGRDIEQFRVESINQIGHGEWCDAVFRIRGAGNIDISSLVIVTNLESPHTLTADHLAFVDEVEINNSPRPRINAGVYPLNFPQESATIRPDRHLNSISLTSDKSGTQTVAVTDRNMVYTKQLNNIVHLQPGEVVMPAVDYTGNWMCAYLYIDKDGNGSFDLAEKITADNPLPACDLVAYSCAYAGDKYFNMDGVTTDNNTLAMKSFSIPADMKPGLYRMRVKIDYMSLDPAGRMDGSNNLTNNGGNVFDFMLNVYHTRAIIKQSGLNGELKMMVDGKATSINSTPVPYGEELTIKQEPAPGFEYGDVTVRYGYNLDGPQEVNGNPCWFELNFPASATGSDGLLHIPAHCILGELRLSSHFLEQN